MSDTAAKIIIVTSEHWLIGMLGTQGGRVLEVLNNPTTDFLRLSDVQVFHGSDHEHRVAALPGALIPKDKVSLVIIPSKKHEVPETKRLEKLVDKKVSYAFLAVPGYTLEGELHLKMRTDDPICILQREVGDFFPVTNATLSGSGMKSIDAPVVIAHQAVVSFFCASPVPPTSIAKKTIELREFEKKIELNLQKAAANA